METHYEEYKIYHNVDKISDNIIIKNSIKDTKYYKK